MTTDMTDVTSSRAHAVGSGVRGRHCPARSPRPQPPGCGLPRPQSQRCRSQPVACARVTSPRAEAWAPSVGLSHSTPVSPTARHVPLTVGRPRPPPPARLGALSLAGVDAVRVTSTGLAHSRCRRGLDDRARLSRTRCGGPASGARDGRVPSSPGPPHSPSRLTVTRWPSVSPWAPPAAPVHLSPCTQRRPGSPVGSDRPGLSLPEGQTHRGAGQLNGTRMGPGAPQPDAASAGGRTQGRPRPPDPRLPPRGSPVGFSAPVTRPPAPHCHHRRSTAAPARGQTAGLRAGRRAGSWGEGTLALGFR